MFMAFLRKYNTLTVTGTTAIRIPIIKRGVVDFAVSADWTPAAGDVKIAIDGAAAANVTNLPTAVAMGNGAYWEFILTAAELTCKSCVVTVADSATKAVEDQAFIVETFGHASAMYPVDLSAATLPVNATQFAGQTITAAAGVTIPSSIASPTNITAATGVVLSGVTHTGAVIPTVTTVTNQLTAATISSQVASDLATAHGAGSWATATGFSTHSAADVWAVGTRTITGGSLTTSPPTAAAIADAVWDEARAGHTTDGTFGFYVDAAISSISAGSGATAQQVWEYATRTLTGAVELDSAVGTQINKIEAAVAGTVTGAGTATEIFVGPSATLTITVDSSGNRSAVVVT